MKQFTIHYEEVAENDFDVEAETAEEAEKKFGEMLENGEIDFRHMYLSRSDYYVVEE